MNASEQASGNGQAQPRIDRFGFKVDPAVGYSRGEILKSELDESARQKNGFRLARQHHARLGDAGVYNLTGLIRGFPYAAEDSASLPSYVHFATRYDGQLERLALARLGGNPQEHDAFLATRVSAGMLAIMLTLLPEGGRVLSLVAADRSHPSVRQAVTLARGVFEETIGGDAFQERIAQYKPDAVVITTISPSKHHLPLADTLAAIEAAKKIGALVILDDAHMAARTSIYDEPPGLALAAGAVDAMVWSLDKHMIGPRSGIVAGKRELVQRIRARALSVGLEAQLGQILAGVRAIEAFDPEPIRAAERMARELLAALQPEADGRFYLAGAGVALAGDDLLDIVQKRSNRPTRIAPIEAVAFAAMRLLKTEGAATIPSFGVPGAAAVYRLMLYPDGARIGLNRMVQGTRDAFKDLVEAHSDPARARDIILGPAS